MSHTSTWTKDTKRNTKRSHRSFTGKFMLVIRCKNKKQGFRKALEWAKKNNAMNSMKYERDLIKKLKAKYDLTWLDLTWLDLT